VSRDTCVVSPLSRWPGTLQSGCNRLSASRRRTQSRTTSSRDGARSRAQRRRATALGTRRRDSHGNERLA
jgi:hypothetical protein